MIADWMGSSQAVFEYERPDYDLATYWRKHGAASRASRPRAVWRHPNRLSAACRATPR